METTTSPKEAPPPLTRLTSTFDLPEISTSWLANPIDENTNVATFALTVILKLPSDAV